MPANKQLVRGTTAFCDARTSPGGCVELDTDRNEFRIHDGATAGGLFIIESKTVVDAAIAVVQTDINTHDALTNNPHTVTAAQIGVEAGATADQTGAEIKTAYEAESDTNAYTDAEKTKLAGVDTGAKDDQTGAEIKTAYEAESDTNAYTDADAATVGDLNDGEYTPTISATTNLDATTAGLTQYSRNGDYCTMAGRISLNATATGACTFEMTVPIPSNFGGTTQANGVLVAGTGTYFGHVTASVANDKLVFTVEAATTADRVCGFTLMYRVV